MLDSFKTQRYCSLFNLPKKNNYTFIQSDVRNLNNFSKKIGKIDVVVHLAALTDATNSFENGKEFIKTNFYLLQFLLHLAHPLSLNKVFFDLKLFSKL